jgi:hypothetical protein
MGPNLAMISNGKKFMWDGQSYASRKEADCVLASYEKNKFEVWTVEQDGKFLVYTRRIVKEVPVTEP